MSFWAEDRSVAVRFLGKLKGLSSTPPFFGPHPHPSPAVERERERGVSQERGTEGEGEGK